MGKAKKQGGGSGRYDGAGPILFSEEFKGRAASLLPGGTPQRVADLDPEGVVENYVLLTALTACRALRPEVYEALGRASLPFRDYWGLYRDLGG